MVCLVPVTHRSEALSRTKSEGQICTLCANTDRVEEEVTSVPANLDGLVNTLTVFPCAL